MALLLPLMVFGLPSGSASAAVTNGCNFGQFPNVPGGQSQLTVNCTFTNAGSSSNETVEDFPQAVWHNGAAWTVAGGVTTVGSQTVTSTSSLAHFNAATDINDTISGLGIPADSFIIAVNSPTSVTLNTNAAASHTGDTLTINNTSTRAVIDGTSTSGSKTITSGTRTVFNGVTTSGSTTITSATVHFAATDVGATVTDTDVPVNDKIASVTNLTTAVLTTAATATGTKNLTIKDLGNANFTAADVGATATGTDIPLYDTIASVTNATTAVLTTAATATGTAETLTIVSPTAPTATREVTDAQLTSGSTTLTSASAGFQTSDLQLPVTGCGIPAATYISSITDSADVVMSQAATLTRPIAVADGVTTSGSTTVTSATANFSTACDKDKAISGTGIPTGAYISLVTNATTVVLSAKATATATGVSLTESPGVSVVIGLPTPTAPANADAVSTIGTTLALNPALVKGVQPCSAAEPAGETIEGGWYNPGDYQGTALSPGPADLPTDTIGQILYPTSVVSFAGYVVNEAASTPGEQDTAAHTDIILPFVPTSLALCATPALGIGSSFSFNGSSIAQQKVVTGIGTPGTAAVRGIENLGSGVSTTTGTAYLTNGVGSSPYSGACTTNFPAAITDVPCS
jgi:hypothetical protein